MTTSPPPVTDAAKHDGDTASSSIYAWSESGQKGASGGITVASILTVVQRVAYHTMTLRMNETTLRWLRFASTVLEILQLGLIGIGQLVFVAFSAASATSCHAGRWSWQALLTRVPRDPTPSGDYARLAVALAIAVFGCVVVLVLVAECFQVG
jgi:hypothetical protein